MENRPFTDWRTGKTGTALKLEPLMKTAEMFWTVISDYNTKTAIINIIFSAITLALIVLSHFKQNIAVSFLIKIWFAIQSLFIGIVFFFIFDRSATALFLGGPFSSLLACIVMFLSSCYVYFTSPPFLTSECRLDGELLGNWERDEGSPRDFSSKYRFTRRSDTVMDVWTENDHILAVTCRTGGSHYLMAWDPDEKVAGAPGEYPRSLLRRGPLFHQGREVLF